MTPLQMIAAVNAVATSGYLMRPHLLMGFGDTNGDLHPEISPEPVRRVIEAETAERLTELLVGVVRRGTGRRAAIPGYRVAGKTGDAAQQRGDL